MPVTVLGYPATSDRSRGWLRYMYRKATTEDNWDKEGQPHPHWDDRTHGPGRTWHRMDLWASMYAYGADVGYHPGVARGLRPGAGRARIPPHRLLGRQGLAGPDRSSTQGGRIIPRAGISILYPSISGASTTSLGGRPTGWSPGACRWTQSGQMAISSSRGGSCSCWASTFTLPAITSGTGLST